MEKQALYEIIEENAPSIIALSDRIWELSELSMEEYQSAEYYCALLEREGFAVERQLCGIPTAFSGSFGSGSPRIGILGVHARLLPVGGRQAERASASGSGAARRSCGLCPAGRSLLQRSARRGIS